MPSIGAPLRKWTLFLLLCTAPTHATVQAANEASTPEAEAGVTSASSTPANTVAPVPLVTAASSSTPPARNTFHGSETACPARTINYVTHTLPQQCARTSWAARSDANSTYNSTVANSTYNSTVANSTYNSTVANSTYNSTVANSTYNSTVANSTHNSTVPELDGIAVPQTKLEVSHDEPENTNEDRISHVIASVASQVQESGSAASHADTELETDSPFDNANFLSFEEWKKKNLEQVGQSPENVGQGRAAPSSQPARRRPVNVNALDFLGDEGEIEIDFSGFGNAAGKDNPASNTRQAAQDTGATTATVDEGKAAPSLWALSKDAGKTCKERFNYASFDCAATVLKTNKRAKSSTSILVENKDSYMLNECSADNKFLIVELCDDILVDTIVLANYEFFSSMFRHFRVSVSDRYPVKIERWRTLGTFEARNSRDIQPFLITEPQIWARYLRIEFLTQYGNEFYCPLSLLRVHGTTMMEQFRREEEEARGIEDDDADLETEVRDVVKPAEDSGPLSPDQLPIQAMKVEEDALIREPSFVATSAAVPGSENISSQVGQQVSHQSPYPTAAAPVSQPIENASSTGAASSSTAPQHDVTEDSNIVYGGDSSGIVSTKVETPTQDYGQASDASTVALTPSTTQIPTSTASDITPPGSISSGNQLAKPVSNITGAGSSVQPPSRGSSTQPNAAVPSTQESFFKSIHKRLLYLEANSTLSLQYIEEQSRSLRDAFVKVEKRQLAKTEKFLDHLNSTVMLELRSFRNMYDQLWQSTVIELESMKERQKSEMGEIGARLSLMADELVWQKRMAVVQSTLLLVCLGLVLFVRSPTSFGSPADVPIVQHLGSKYSSFFDTPPPRKDSPESGAARRRRTFRSMWRSDTSAGLSDRDHDRDHDPHSDRAALSDADTEAAHSPLQNEYRTSSPDSTTTHLPTPPPRLPDEQEDNDISLHLNRALHSPGSDDKAARIHVLETQSGPATPNGTRDCRPSWEEVDRAMDELEAEVRGEALVDRGWPDRKGTSLLRRAYSGCDGVGHGHEHGGEGE